MIMDVLKELDMEQQASFHIGGKKKNHVQPKKQKGPLHAQNYKITLGIMNFYNTKIRYSQNLPRAQKSYFYMCDVVSM